jgi:hypothetical protein
LFVCLFSGSGSTERERDWKGKFRSISQLGGHQLSNKVIHTMICHPHAPYTVSIGNDGRACIWKIPESQLLQVSGTDSQVMEYVTYLTNDVQVTEASAYHTANWGTQTT